MSAPEPNFKRIAGYYDALVGKYGASPRSADYGQTRSQLLKFRVLAEALPATGMRVLDVGCGLADFHSFLARRHRGVRYVGIDLSPAMVALAKRRHPRLDLRLGNIFDDAPGRFDVVYANGIFYLLGRDGTRFMKRFIRKAFALSRRALAFNSLSRWAPEKERGEFYADPEEILAYCRNLTPWVVLRQDYHPRDFTIYMYKNAECMIVSINQPAYLPWLGYFQRIAASDLHVVLDHVQFEKNSFTNRNQIKTAQGATWLTVPARTKGRFGGLAIRALEIDNTTDWRGKHWKTILQSYRRAPHFDEHAPFFEQVYRREWTLLHDLLEETTGYLLRALGIATPLRSSSAMEPRGTKDELVLELCRKAGADAYLSGALGKDYLREELFQQAGIQVDYQDYRHPEYPQLHAGFVSHLSVIDLLFNCGARSLQILKAQ